MLRQEPTQTLPLKLLKEATIHFYCLFDESSFSDICKIIELKELNWLRKHMKNVRSSQPCLSMNFCTEFSKALFQWIFVLNSAKHKFFPVSIVKVKDSFRSTCSNFRASLKKDLECFNFRATTFNHQSPFLLKQ